MASAQPVPEQEKPLNVRVAEALEWTDLRHEGDYIVNPPVPHWTGRPPGNLLVGPQGRANVPDYPTDWSATGPIIERCRISLRSPEEPEAVLGNWWEAYHWAGDGSESVAGGRGPLAAACHLLLALKEAGKL